MNKCPGVLGESHGYLPLGLQYVVVASSDRKRVDMTTGTVAPKLLTLAWPLVLGNLLQTVYNLADLFWVGRVNSESVAAVSLMFPLTYLFISTAMGLTAATIALVSQNIGAGDDRQADRVVGQTLLLALSASVTLAALGWVFRTDILSLMGAEGAVFDAALAYIEVIFFALPLTFLFFAFRGSLQGAGDTRTAMWLMLISAGVNVIIDPVFILGWGPVPAMGVRGAAWATFIARALAAGAGVYVLVRGGFGVRLRLRDLVPNPAILRRLVNVGSPAAIDGWAQSSAAVVMAALVTPFGTAAIAAYGIGIRLMSVTWTVARAVGQATATGVGQNLGADTPDRAARVTWIAAGATMSLLLAATVLTLAVPDQIIGVFDDNPAVVDEGKTFLWIIAPVWALFGGTMVLQGAFRGAGQTTVAMGLSLLSRWAFRLPVIIVLAFSAARATPSATVPGTGHTLPGAGIGVEGVWIGFAVGATLSFLVAVGWFLLGQWTDGIVDADEAGEATLPEAEPVDDGGTKNDQERPRPDPEIDTDG